MDDLIQESDFIFYRGEDGKVHAQVILGDQTVWVSQKTMSEIFGTTRENITYHLKNIYQEQEVEEEATSKEILLVRKEGNREVSRNVWFYNLDTIVAVGYRISSYKATKFRQWSSRIITEYLVKGFVLDDERLKQGNRLFGKDYFKELLERIKEIRASERMFYEKITDLYATSVDYDSNDPSTKKFFAKVQNKLEYAIVGKTSAEIIRSRGNANMPNMGLTTWKNYKRDGKIQKSDVTIAKNYLKQDELKALNLLVSSFLDYAEMIVSRNKIMKMTDWSERLDKFLDFNEYMVLKNAGKIKKDVADAFAESEFAKFRVFQDQDYKSEFNTFSEQIKSKGSLPNESDLFIKDTKKVSDFDNTLNIALNPKANKSKKSQKEDKSPTKKCPNCGKITDKETDYCDGDIEVDGEIVPCGHSFRYQF